jgi:hypothetical protein
MIGKEIHHSAKAIYQDKVQRLEVNKKELLIKIVDLMKKEKFA